MKKLYQFALEFVIASCTKQVENPIIDNKVPTPPTPVTYTYTQTYSTSPMLLLGSVKNISSTDLNLNQYLNPIWNNRGMLFNLESVKKTNSWVGVTTTLVNDFNNDGFQDLFISFMGSENESIPFKLYLYDQIEKKLVDKSDLISENIGQSFNRKAMCADLNGDKILDFICVSHPEANNMDLSYFDIIISEGQKWKQKRLKVASRLKSEGYYHGFAIGDVDNDKDIDIVLAMWHNPTQGITTFLNDGKGAFVEKKSIVMSGENLPEENMSFTQELSDINNDNNLDLIYWGSQNTYIKFGNNDGTFGGSYLKLNQSFSWDYKFVDLDQDNLKDLIIFYSDNIKKVIF
ncbi:MAG: FG-GAP repeat domain-containing protein, partial [Sediminibacterium sp.]